MVSPEERNQNPYALAVLCIPYKGLSDAKGRDLTNKVIHETTQRKMKVSGTQCIQKFVNVLLIIYPNIRVCNKWGIELSSHKREYQAIVSTPDP